MNHLLVELVGEIQGNNSGTCLGNHVVLGIQIPDTCMQIMRSSPLYYFSP